MERVEKEAKLTVDLATIILHANQEKLKVVELKTQVVTTRTEVESLKDEAIDQFLEGFTKAVSVVYPNARFG